MSFYSNLQQLVLKLFTKYGVSITLRQYSAGAGDYDPNTQRATPAGTTGTYDHARKAIIQDAPGSRLAQQFGQTNNLGTSIQRSGKWIYIDAIGVVPKLQAHVIVSGVESSIVDVQTIGPGGVALMYLLVLES